MDINRDINRLLHFARQQHLIDRRDSIYAANRLIYVLRASEFISEAVDETLPSALPVLDSLLGFAVERGIVADSYEERELFKTRLMDCVMPRPSEVEARFWADYAVSPRLATDNFYRFCKATNYINQEKDSRKAEWKVSSPYGELEISINVSKPDRELEEITELRTRRRNVYPRCPLCIENEGFAGTASSPARRTLRLISLELDGRRWYWQYSPYLYFNEHSVLLSAEHNAGSLSRDTFRLLLAFLDKFPHYFIGAGADLPVLGGALQAHEHYITGCCRFPIEDAPFEKSYCFAGFESITAGRLRWPVPVIRLQGTDARRLTVLADKIRRTWYSWDDETVGLRSSTDGVPHHTLTIAARKRGDIYELDIALRSNLRTKERPQGLFFQRPQLRHIKKEPFGIAEVLGREILPPRLMTTMQEVREELLRGSSEIEDIRSIAKHDRWYKYLRAEYPDISDDNVNDIMREEIGRVFLKALGDIAVFKSDEAGQAAFDRFAAALGTV